jgi:hypothetical protein
VDDDAGSVDDRVDAGARVRVHPVDDLRRELVDRVSWLAGEQTGPLGIDRGPRDDGHGVVVPGADPGRERAEHGIDSGRTRPT